MVKSTSVLLINMGKASTSDVSNPVRSATIQSILDAESADIIFAQEVIGPKNRKWWPRGGSYEWRNTGTEAAVLWNNDTFTLEKEVDSGSKQKLYEQMTTTGKEWAKDRETLGEISSRVTIVCLKHKESGKYVLAVSWHGPHKKHKQQKVLVLEALQDFCMEVKQLRQFDKLKPVIVIGGDFNLCLDSPVKPKLGFVVENKYTPSKRRQGKVIDYFVHTGDIKMDDIKPIEHIADATGSGASASGKDKTMTGSVKASTSKAGAETSRKETSVKASSSSKRDDPEKPSSSSAGKDESKSKKIKAVTLDPGKESSTKLSDCLDHDPLKSKLIFKP